TSAHLDTPIRLPRARPEEIAVTDPAHPLYGRRFVLVSVTCSSNPNAHVSVAYLGDVVLKIPVAATSLHPAPRGGPSSKLSRDAIGDLVRLAARGDAAQRSIPRDPGHAYPRADAEPPSAPSLPPLGGEP
ncbi:MAG TPA: hypothetical protein VFG47_14915, partial [Geminicoccaceae bacterium]|nr:hypothetical protein [Geminicoccaceae bacterium]